MSGSPMDYNDTKELLEVGESYGPQPQQDAIAMVEVPATIVCNDQTQTHIKADGNSWGYMDIGVFVNGGVWSYDQFHADTAPNAPDPKREDCLIPFTMIHHITFDFNEDGTNTDD